MFFFPIRLSLIMDPTVLKEVQQSLFPASFSLCYPVRIPLFPFFILPVLFFFSGVSASSSSPFPCVLSSLPFCPILSSPFLFSPLSFLFSTCFYVVFPLYVFVFLSFCSTLPRFFPLFFPFVFSLFLSPFSSLFSSSFSGFYKPKNGLQCNV